MTAVPAPPLPQPAPPGLACATCWQDAHLIDPVTGAALCVPCAADVPTA